LNFTPWISFGNWLWPSIRAGGADTAGCGGAADHLLRRGEFSYVVSRSEDIDLK
jgi:hypothetical protein